jgi:long-chain acyl-CoA synthetase
MTVDRPEGMQRLDHALRAACATTHPGRPALVDEEETITFAELGAQANGAADLLTAAGLEFDEPVLVTVSNRARDLVAFFAVWCAGGVVVPVHRKTPAPEIEGLMDRTGARLSLNLRADIAVADNLAGDDPVCRLPTARRSFPDVLEGAAWLNFTSGSTGEPKGVVHGHDAYLAKLEMIDGMLRYSEHERVLLVLQLSFSFAQWVSLLTLIRGGTVVLREKFRAESFLDALGADITRVAVVPTMMRALRSQPIPSMEASFAGTIMAGGETMEASLGEWARERWPHAHLWDIYGLTETATCDFFVRPEEREIAAGTIGRPAPGIDFRIAEPDGELQIRSPFIMRGYFDAPDLTAGAFDDGFFRTGDLARELPTGHVQLVGRRKDIINRGGINVSPLEVERLFLNHDEIAAALATGLPDDIKGETLHIMVVPTPGSVVTEASLLQWAREQMNRDKIPDAVHVASALPEGRTGKADRNALRDILTR